MSARPWCEAGKPTYDSMVAAAHGSESSSASFLAVEWTVEVKVAYPERSLWFVESAVSGCHRVRIPSGRGARELTDFGK